MRLVKLLAMAFAALALGFGTASAQDDTFQADTMIQSGDYDSFKVEGGSRPARACAEACERDPRCQAWTFIRPVGQCRLKSNPGEAVANKCCVSGYKEVKAPAGGSASKQEFCAGYAEAAVEANDRNREQGCGLRGDRWTSNYKDHYAWCIRSPRAAVDDEADQRDAEISECRQQASIGAKGVCDHYARISMVQVDTNAKAKCGFGADDPRWATSATVHVRACERAPNQVPGREIPYREALLDQCFQNAGRSERACNDYAVAAIAAFQKAVDNNCEFGESRRWNGSKQRHTAWCLDASEQQRAAETKARSDEVGQCIRLAQQRKDCEAYAGTAIAQALRNERQRCGFRGVTWSKYTDDHYDFCMQANAGDRDAEAARRDRDLKKCEQKEVVDEECDTYATRAVRLNDLAEEKDCRLTGRDLWSSNRRQHYQFCLESNYEERRELQQQRRRQIRQCAFQRGFTISIDIDF
jgi:hypothetical protein